MACKLVKSNKEDYELGLIRNFKENTKGFYKYIKSSKQVKDRVAQVRDSLGNLTITDQKTAEVFNDYFASVFIQEGNEPLPPFADRNDNNCIENISFTIGDVQSSLENLRRDKSMGPDGLHPYILSECANYLAVPLFDIMSESMRTGTVPNDWKRAEVVPIYKKGDRSLPENYRPISLTSVICKILERLIKNDIVQFIDKLGSFTKDQHGFMKGRSCLTNLLETFEDWTSNLDEGLGIDSVYLDYRKAFDSVPHERLLKKLRAYGIRGKLLEWIRNFLTDRTIRVLVNGKFSKWARVLSGVPQGSVLGPLLFLLFVNDIPDELKCRVKMFADDTKIWNPIGKLQDEDMLREDLGKLEGWSNKWLLKFNAGKCKVMTLGHKFNTSYTLDENSLEKIHIEKDLGVWVSNDLKPSLQCSKAASKAFGVLASIKRNFTSLNKEGFTILYRTFIRPHLEYCIQAWSPYLQKDIQCLERVQRKATKMVKGLKKINYEDRLKILNLFPLSYRRVRGDMIEVFKILSGIENVEANTFFKLSVTTNLRGQSKKLFKNRARLQLRQNFFSQRVVSVWNGLPETVIQATSVSMFKKRLDKLWINGFDVGAKKFI